MDVGRKTVTFFSCLIAFCWLGISTGTFLSEFMAFVMTTIRLKIVNQIRPLHCTGEVLCLGSANIAVYSFLCRPVKELLTNY